MTMEKEERSKVRENLREGGREKSLVFLNEEVQQCDNPTRGI